MSNKPRDSHGISKKSWSNSNDKKKHLTHSILVKGDRHSPNFELLKYQQLINNISRSTNMIP